MIDPTAIDQATDKWSQGDWILVDHLPSDLQFDMLTLRTGEEIEPPSGKPVDWDTGLVDGFLLVSQTCDVARPWKAEGTRNWVQVVPLVKLKSDRRKAILNGAAGRQYFITDALNEAEVAADLERALTLSKPALAALTPYRLEGCRTRADRWRLARALAEKASRAAFPNDFTSSGKGREGAIAELEGYLSQGLRGGGDLQTFLETVDEIRIRPFGEDKHFPWESPRVGVLFFFVLNGEEPSLMDVERWEACAQGIVERMKTNGRYELHGSGYAIRTWHSLTAAEYRSSDWLPF